jgi:hypothetical protein
MENRKSKAVNLVVLSRTLRLPLRWLKSEAEAGRIPSLKAGNVLLFNIDAVRKVLAERASKTNPSLISAFSPFRGVKA